MSKDLFYISMKLQVYLLYFVSTDNDYFVLIITKLRLTIIVYINIKM